MIYISDLDGTLADLSHRLPLIKCASPDWPSFFRACPNDAPITDVIDLLQDLYSCGQRIMYVSGRSDEVRDETATWLNKWACPPGPLFMRKEGDHRPDYIVKSELLDDLLSQYPQKGIAGVFEDRAQVVQMYRQRGFRVYQVAEGDF